METTAPRLAGGVGVLGSGRSHKVDEGTHVRHGTTPGVEDAGDGVFGAERRAPHVGGVDARPDLVLHVQHAHVLVRHNAGVVEEAVDPTPPPNRRGDRLGHLLFPGNVSAQG